MSDELSDYTIYACDNTDKVIHENVDCRLIITKQHALGIDVGGSVIVLDPLDWHRMAKQVMGISTNNQNKR